MTSYRIEDLLQLMRALRSPEYGCPWDKKQSFESLIPYTLEEAYEVADAIEQGDRQALRLELGDLLFQVIFYAQLGDETGDFCFDDIVTGITEKLLRRHPHVFPDGSLASAGSGEVAIDESQVKSSWERIKAQEKSETERDSLMDDIPVALPAFLRAYKMQKRAATVGFDWPDYRQVTDKVSEELDELNQAVVSGEADKILEELGDLLFSCINLARHLKIDPESALRGTIAKFDRRFRYIEAQAKNKNRNVAQLSLSEMEEAWNKAKGESSNK